MDTESYDFVLNEMGSVGFKISVDHPLDMPVIQQSGERHSPLINLQCMVTSGVSVAPGTSNELGVRVEIMNVSSDTLNDYPDDPEKRKCYLNEDVSFQVY